MVLRRVSPGCQSGYCGRPGGGPVTSSGSLVPALGSTGALGCAMGSWRKQQIPPPPWLHLSRLCPGSLPLRSVLSLLVASGPGVEENGLEPGPELCFPDPSLMGWTKNSRPRPCGFDTLAGAVGNQTCSEELRLGLLPRIGALSGTMKQPILHQAYLTSV